jgi:hypothetical protein
MEFTGFRAMACRDFDYRGNQAHRAEPYASLYVSYAMISSLAYTPRQNLNQDLCPEATSFDKDKDAEAIAWMRSLNARKWNCVLGLSETLPCPASVSRLQLDRYFRPAGVET